MTKHGSRPRAEGDRIKIDTVSDVAAKWSPDLKCSAWSSDDHEPEEWHRPHPTPAATAAANLTTWAVNRTGSSLARGWSWQTLSDTCGPRNTYVPARLTLC